MVNGGGRGLAKGCSVDVRKQIFQRADGCLGSKMFILNIFCFDLILEWSWIINWVRGG